MSDVLFLDEFQPNAFSDFFWNPMLLVTTHIGSNCSNLILPKGDIVMAVHLLIAKDGVHDKPIDLASSFAKCGAVPNMIAPLFSSGITLRKSGAESSLAAMNVPSGAIDNVAA